MSESYGTNLFIGDLASVCTETHIQHIFREHGFELLDVSEF